MSNHKGLAIDEDFSPPLAREFPSLIQIIQKSRKPAIVRLENSSEYVISNYDFFQHAAKGGSKQEYHIQHDTPMASTRENKDLRRSGK